MEGIYKDLDKKFLEAAKAADAEDISSMPEGTLGTIETLQSIPGIGERLAVRLTVEIGGKKEMLAAFRSAAKFSAYLGVALLTMNQAKNG